MIKIEVNKIYKFSVEWNVPNESIILKHRIEDGIGGYMIFLHVCRDPAFNMMNGDIENVKHCLGCTKDTKYVTGKVKITKRIFYGSVGYIGLYDDENLKFLYD